MAGAIVERFMAEWPETQVGRLEASEKRLLLKREWLRLFMDLELGGEHPEVMEMGYAELAEEFEDQVLAWDWLVEQLIQDHGYDLDALAAVSDQRKLAMLVFHSQDWIKQVLFDAWRGRVGVL